MAERPHEHRSGGMLAGARVRVLSSSWHGKTWHAGTIVDFNSVPAAHIVIDRGEGEPRRIIFCSAIEYIEEAP